MTNPISTTEATIIKADKLGRVHTPPEQREALLDAFEQSGMSGAAFAKLHGIRYSTFANWRQRRRGSFRRDDSVPFFEEVDVNHIHSGNIGLTVLLPGGASVKVDRADPFPLVTALLKYLEHSC